jgi:group II intron reverse transcriptase/maturase
MSEINLFNYQQNLFERVCSIEELDIAFRAVKRNGGAPGVDGVTVNEFESRCKEELSQLKKDIESWTYEPSPVRRVEIPKPGGAGIRLLGIPTVRDRVLHTAIKAVLEPLFDPLFSKNSYGFRPGRNQRQAVEAAQAIVQSGKEHVVDIDLSQFFDRIHHDRLIQRLGLEVQDKRILRLIGLTLRSGIMSEGVVTIPSEGSVQGSPLSPLLSNVVLDELDKELERRGLEFCRFADDCNIFVRSPKSAERVMQAVTKFIEKRLKLVVNRDKSKVALSKAVKFLGMTIVAGTIAISEKSMSRAMDKTRELTQRGTSLSIEQAIEKINSWYVGWASYYSMTQYPYQLLTIEAHLRRRLRARIVSQQKTRRNLFHKLMSRGITRRTAAKHAFSNDGRWKLSYGWAVRTAFNNDWFIYGLGQKVVSNKQLPHWFESDLKVSFT